VGPPGGYQYQYWPSIRTTVLLPIPVPMLYRGCKVVSQTLSRSYSRRGGRGFVKEVCVFVGTSTNIRSLSIKIAPCQARLRVYFFYSTSCLQSPQSPSPNKRKNLHSCQCTTNHQSITNQSPSTLPEHHARHRRLTANGFSRVDPDPTEGKLEESTGREGEPSGNSTGSLRHCHRRSRGMRSRRRWWWWWWWWQRQMMKRRRRLRPCPPPWCTHHGESLADPRPRRT
jgi:hypothetical protein